MQPAIEAAGVNIVSPGCARQKVRHSTWLSAELARQKIECRDAERGRRGSLNVYWCGECASYHVGNSSLRRKRA